MARIAWLCPDRQCNPSGMDGQPIRFTDSIAPTEAPTCQWCGADLVWRPA